MGNPKMPVDLLVHTGRSRLTKAEIAERQASEVHAPYSGEGDVPKYLNKAQRAEFDTLSVQLADIGIYADIDAGVLARYCVAHWMYARYTKQLASAPRKKAKRIRAEALERGDASVEDYSDIELAVDLERELAELQSKYYRQCEDSAKVLGLSVTSRCKLVIPKPAENPRVNKFARFDRSG